MEKILKIQLDMEEATYPVIHINIYGGNNQILPNATKAEQYFYDASAETRPAEQPLLPSGWTPDDEKRFSLYIGRKEELPAYIATLAACRTAKEVGEAVALMCADDPKLDGRLVSTEKFIRVILPFLTGVSKGKGIDNLRINIDDAWAAYRKNRKEKPDLG